MGVQIKSAAKCPTCGAALHIGAEDHSARCKYCHTLVEISRFTQEEKRLVRAIEEMQESLSEAEKRMEEAAEEFARTGSLASGTLQRQSEEQYRRMSEALEQKQAAYENAQARKLNGYFRLGEEAQRARRYEEAIGHYQKILAVCEEEAEVHWRVLMCRYGVEYVRDQLTGIYLPTLTRMNVDDILRDADYIAACEFAQDEDVRSYYRREGERLSEILAKYQHIGGTTEPYDVFISVKQGDDEGRPTDDSMVGMNLYYQLTAQGLRVFNSRISLKAGEEYEPHIMHALMSAKVLVLVASNEDYLNSRWLRNEWRRFAWLKKSEGVQSERKIIVYSCAQNMLKIPAEIGAVQIIDAKSSVAPVEALYRSVREVCKKGTDAGEEPVAPVKPVIPEKNVVPAEPTQECEKQIKKAAKDGEKQSKKAEKAAQKREKKGAEPIISENREVGRASAETDEPDTGDMQSSEGRKTKRPAALKWVLWGIGAAGYALVVGLKIHKTNQFGWWSITDLMFAVAREVLLLAGGLIGLRSLGRKNMHIKRGAGSMIAQTLLIVLWILGTAFLSDVPFETVWNSVSPAQEYGMSFAQAALLVLLNAVLSAVCVKRADRLTGAGRECVLSVAGWSVFAGYSFVMPVFALLFGAGVYVLGETLMGACLIAGTMLWLREKKAKA